MSSASKGSPHQTMTIIINQLATNNIEISGHIKAIQKIQTKLIKNEN